MIAPLERRELVIVGGGPAGTATALALHQRAPDLAAHALLLDRADFPREKPCGGGLIPATLEHLRGLEVPLSAPFVRVDRARVQVERATIEMQSPACCWVIRRREFDEMLLAAVRERGVEVRTGVRVREATRVDGGVLLDTNAGPIRARAVVAADGSGSLLRRRLVDPDEGWVGRAVTCDVPIAEETPPDVYHFDFREVPRGLRGYAWAFPCRVGARPHWNVGAYSLVREGEGARLGRILDEWGVGPARRRAHPIRFYAPGRPVAAPGVLLVGDAAGAEPLLGEGISFALEYGQIAARALCEGFRAGDLSFKGYQADVAQSPLGRKLRWLGRAARLFYGPRSGLFFGLAGLSRTAQRYGMNWYNGVGWSGHTVARSPTID